MRYALAPNGVFWSIQGEGHLQGFQMAFLRLAGCPVSCPGCDTDYSKAESVELVDLVNRVRDVVPGDDRDQWVWVTGGEPAALEQRKQVELISALKGAGLSVAVATSGYRRFIPPVDWLSVSPHSMEPEMFQQRYGNEVKLIDGLNGLDLDAWYDRWEDKTDFLYRYAQPGSVPGGSGFATDPSSLARCMAFLRVHPRWGLSEQRHHRWGIE